VDFCGSLFAPYPSGDDRHIGAGGGSSGGGGSGTARAGIAPCGDAPPSRLSSDEEERQLAEALSLPPVKCTLALLPLFTIWHDREVAEEIEEDAALLSAQQADAGFSIAPAARATSADASTLAATDADASGSGRAAAHVASSASAASASERCGALSASCRSGDAGRIGSDGDAACVGIEQCDSASLSSPPPQQPGAAALSAALLRASPMASPLPPIGLRDCEATEEMKESAAVLAPGCGGAVVYFCSPAGTVRATSAAASTFAAFAADAGGSGSAAAHVASSAADASASWAQTPVRSGGGVLAEGTPLLTPCTAIGFSIDADAAAEAAAADLWSTAHGCAETAATHMLRAPVSKTLAAASPGPFILFSDDEDAVEGEPAPAAAWYADACFLVQR
jgi:hypothetical protein